MLREVTVGAVSCDVVVYRVTMNLDEREDADGTPTAGFSFSVSLALRLPSGDLYPLGDPEEPMGLQDDEIPADLSAALLEFVAGRVRGIFGSEPAPVEHYEKNTRSDEGGGFTGLDGGETFSLEE